MTARAKLDAQEQRETLFAAADWSCVVCGSSIYTNSIPQLAHRIAQTKVRIRAYGEEVMHHPLNLIPVCCLAHNDRCNIGNQGLVAVALIHRIQRVLDGEEPEPNMAEEYLAMRKEFRQSRER